MLSYIIISFVSFLAVKIVVVWGNCRVILGSSVFPAACRFLSFGSRNARENLAKTATFLTHTPFPSTMVVGAGNTSRMSRFWSTMCIDVETHP